MCLNVSPWKHMCFLCATFLIMYICATMCHNVAQNMAKNMAHFTNGIFVPQCAIMWHKTWHTLHLLVPTFTCTYFYWCTYFFLKCTYLYLLLLVLNFTDAPTFSKMYLFVPIFTDVPTFSKMYLFVPTFTCTYFCQCSYFFECTYLYLVLLIYLLFEESTSECVCCV